MQTLKILIVEDESRIAKRVGRLVKEILNQKEVQYNLVVKDRLLAAMDYIQQHPIDLLLLDLNLSGRDGFELLKTVLAEAFSTIIISAYREKAIEAFEYGVLDFVPKPFDRARLELALNRMLDSTQKGENSAKFIALKKQGKIQLVPVENIRHIQGANIYSELHLNNGKKELSDKSLDTLFQLLPPYFARIHKSYIINMKEAETIVINPGGKYELKLKNGQYLPIGRTRYKQIKQQYFSTPEKLNNQSSR